MRIGEFKSLAIRSGLVAASLVLTFSFQIHYLAAFDVDDRVSLFYIPAAVITLSALTLRYNAAIGIFVGYAAINLVMHSTDIPSALLLSAAPALVTIATIWLLSLLFSRIGNFFSPTSTLIDIDAFDILIFCAGYGVINASLHHLLFYFDPDFATPVSLLSVTQMMFGDLTGSFLGFIALNLAYSVLSRLSRKDRRGSRRA